jgi:hypothetical protein
MAWVFPAVAALCSAVLLVSALADRDWIGAAVAAIGVAVALTAVVALRGERRR